MSLGGRAARGVRGVDNKDAQGDPAELLSRFRNPDADITMLDDSVYFPVRSLPPLSPVGFAYAGHYCHLLSLCANRKHTVKESGALRVMCLLVAHGGPPTTCGFVSRLSSSVLLVVLVLASLVLTFILPSKSQPTEFPGLNRVIAWSSSETRKGRSAGGDGAGAQSDPIDTMPPKIEPKADPKEPGLLPLSTSRAAGERRTTLSCLGGWSLSYPLPSIPTVTVDEVNSYWFNLRSSSRLPFSLTSTLPCL